MGCFGPGKEELAAEKIRQENLRLAQELAKLRQQMAMGAQEHAQQLESAHDEIKVLQQQVSTLEAHHASVLTVLEQQFAQQIDALNTSHINLVNTLESKVARFQKEKAKLVEHIERRDQALFLAGQVIDMVDKSGMLLSDSLSMSMFKAAASGPAGPQADTARADTQQVLPAATGDYSPRLHPSHKQQQGSSGQQHVLDELRRSVTAAKKKIADTQASGAASDITLTPPSSRAAPDVGDSLNGSALSARGKNSQLMRSNSGEKNPLWQMSCCEGGGSPAPGASLQDSFQGLTRSKLEPREVKHSDRYAA